MHWLTSTGWQAAAAVTGLFTSLVLRVIQKTSDPVVSVVLHTALHSDQSYFSPKPEGVAQDKPVTGQS